MNLLVDIGNTRLKWTQDVQGVTAEAPICHSDDDFRQHLTAAWRSIEAAPACLAVSCVGCATVLAIVKSVAFELWPELIWLRASAQAWAFGVSNGYRYPDKLGVDRWLCLLAARRLWPEPVCIVDCGTAITIDVMTADGRHLGGLISPGLTVMKRSLFKDTAALPWCDQSFPVGLTDTTEAAIHSGTVLAAVGLIKTVLARQPEPPKLILTGGDAEVIANYLDEAVIMAPNLVLQGLALVVET